MNYFFHYHAAAVDKVHVNYAMCSASAENVENSVRVQLLKERIDYLEKSLPVCKELCNIVTG